MANMDVSGNSFFKDTGNCFEANLGVTKIIEETLKSGGAWLEIESNVSSHLTVFQTKLHV